MIKTIAVAAAALALSGCAGLGTFLNADQSENSVGARILNDIQGCSRAYRGALGAGVSGSFEIVCDPILKDGTHTEPAKGPTN